MFCGGSVVVGRTEAMAKSSHGLSRLAVQHYCGPWLDPMHLARVLCAINIAIADMVCTDVQTGCNLS